MLPKIAFDPVQTPPAQQASQPGLHETCADFESIFITYMLKSMRATISEDGLLGNSNEIQILKSMLDENMAQTIAEGEGFGMGKLLYERLKNQNLNSTLIEPKFD